MMEAQSIFSRRNERVDYNVLQQSSVTYGQIDACNIMKSLKSS